MCVQNKPTHIPGNMLTYGMVWCGFKAVSAERGQLSRLASSEVRTPNPQVARVDNRLPISGAPPPAQLSGATIRNSYSW